MKKLILSFIAVTGFSAAASAQIYFADTSSAVYDTTINGVPNQTQDLSLQLLFGSSPTSFSSIPVVTLLLSSNNTTPSGPQIGQTLSAAKDISGIGIINDASGQGYILDSSYWGKPVYLEVLAWTGNYSSYQSALDSGDLSVDLGISSVFTSNIPLFPSYPNYADIRSVGVVNLVAAPEPSTYALATGGASLASMLFFRRRKS